MHLSVFCGELSCSSGLLLVVVLCLLDQAPLRPAEVLIPTSGGGLGSGADRSRSDIPRDMRGHDPRHDVRRDRPFAGRPEFHVQKPFCFCHSVALSVKP